MSDPLLIHVVISAEMSRTDDPGALIVKLTQAFQAAGIKQLRAISWAPVRELKP